MNKREKNEELYDLAAIQKELYKVVPERYRYYNLSDIFTHDISFYLSIRADGGKTVNALLLCLVLHKLYRITSVYIRNDNKQTTEAVVSDLFDKIEKFGYIETLFENWNCVEYKRNEKAFYLCRREDGIIVDEAIEPFILIRCNELYKSYKSGGAPARAWFIIWDEFLDSDQVHSTILSKMFDNITTFGREDPHVHVMAMSNTVNKYDALFEDLCINRDIEYMEFGESKSITTDLGSRYFINFVPVSEEKKKQIKDKAIRFFGLSNAKFAHLTGVQTWQGYNYQHLVFDREEGEGIISDKLYGLIHHRDHWLGIHVTVVRSKEIEKPIIHITKINAPTEVNRPVYTLTPKKRYEKLLADAPTFFFRAYEENRIYFQTNNLGMLFDDFLSENKMMPIRVRDKR